LQLDGVDAKD
jgi:O-acetyl-ADP-ribose deacetylase (regulator of RNase III)